MNRPLDILLVEDDDLDVMIFERTLRNTCPTANLTRAADGVAALDLIRSGTLPEHFVMVVDINMPRMDGHELVETVRQEPGRSNTIIFMFSTSNSPFDIEAGYQAGINGYVVKPDSREDLARVMRCIQDFWTICECPPNAA